MSKLLPEETSTLARAIVNILTKAALENSLVTASLAMIATKLQILEDALKIGLGSQYTEQLVEQDHRRDQRLIGCRRNIESFTYHEDSTKVDAANALLAVYEKYGTSFYREGYAVQTGIMGPFLQEMENPTNTAHFATLGNAEWLEHIKKENGLFLDLLESRTDQESQKEPKELREKKFDLGEHLNKLLNLVEMMEDQGTTANIDKIVAQLNEEVERAMTRADARETRQENERAKQVVRQNWNRPN